MRIRAAVLTTLLILTGCGGDDDDDGDGSSLSAEQAQEVVDRALLDVDDLGEGWELTETIPPGDDDEPEEDDPFAACMGEDVAAQFEGDDLAESEERTFTLESDGPVPVPSELQVSTGATSDVDELDLIHEVFASDDFAECFPRVFDEEMAAAEEEVEMEIGEFEVSDDLVDVEGARATHLSVPFSVSTLGITIEADVDMVVISRGQVGTFLFTIDFGDAIPDDDLSTWATLIAERQAA